MSNRVRRSFVDLIDTGEYVKNADNQWHHEDVSALDWFDPESLEKCYACGLGSHSNSQVKRCSYCIKTKRLIQFRNCAVCEGYYRFSNTSAGYYTCCICRQYERAVVDMIMSKKTEEINLDQ